MRPQAQEGRLEEEGQQRLHGQQRAEDVADEAAVLAPRQAELELLHEAGGHAEDEVDQVDAAPEAGHPQPLRLVGAHPHGVHDRDHDPQADGQRDHQEVVDGGDPELPACEVQHVHGCLLVPCRTIDTFFLRRVEEAFYSL
jgi:hypothetical protein